MKILVTDGDSRASLAITRSLGSKGHKVVVGEKKKPSLSSSSKFCYESFIYPDPFKNDLGFVKTLMNVIREKAIDIVIPVTDVTTIPVTKNKKELEQYCHIPFSDPGVIELAANKLSSIKLAQELNIPVPKTHFLMNPESFNSTDIDISYPIVVKPSKSRIKSNQGWIATEVGYANNSEELARLVDRKKRMEFPILLQERIVGPGVGVFLCCKNGKVIACFSHRRIREKPPSGGVSVLRESIAVPPLARKYSEALLKHLKWEGVAMVEFKLDHKDNIPKLMEINGRFWGSLQLAIDSGVDFPSILIEMKENSNIKPISSYKVGVKTRWFWGEVDHLLMVLLKRRNDLKLPPDYDGKLMTLLKFLKLWGKDIHYEVLSFRDIRPWIYETFDWMKGAHS